MKNLKLLILSLFILLTNKIFADDNVSFKGEDDYIEGQTISVTFYPSKFSAEKYPNGYVSASIEARGKTLSKNLQFQSGMAPQTLTYTIQKKDVSSGYILINVFYMATPQGPTINSFSKTLTKRKSQADYDQNLKELLKMGRYDDSARHNFKERSNDNEELKKYVGPSKNTRTK